MICSSCQTENDSTHDDCSHCGKDLYSFPQGHVLSGRYEITGRLGRGGMGVVYRALDRELDETVAIKTLRPEAAASAEITRRFRDEIKLARKISHPNVCRIHEYGRDGEIAYIVMELVDGIDVKRILRDHGPLPLEAAYDVAIQVAEALQAIHEGGVVHRDLKTANIVQNESGVVKVMDFGIAKRVDGEKRDPDKPTTSVTASGQIIGTVEYMSPEQVRGEKLDARSDLYALGIVVFEIFTGDVPFRADSFVGTAMKHVQDPLPLEGPHAHLIPAPLVPVLEKALCKSREERFGSAREMAEALRQARGKAPARVGAPPGTRRPSGLPHAPTLVRPRVREGRTMPWLLGVAVILVAGGGAYRTLRSSVPSATPDVSPVESRPAADQTPMPTSPTAAPEAARVVVAASAKPKATTVIAALALEPTATATEAPATAAPPAEEEIARVQVSVTPWAEVALDGNPIGSSPIPVLTLTPGVHVFRFVHPSYQPVLRKVTVEPGQTGRVNVDFEIVGVPVDPAVHPEP